MDSVLNRVNMLKYINVEEEYEDALDGVFPSTLELCAYNCNIPFHCQGYYKKKKKN